MQGMWCDKDFHLGYARYDKVAWNGAPERVIAPSSVLRELRKYPEYCPSEMGQEDGRHLLPIVNTSRVR